MYVNQLLDPSKWMVCTFHDSTGRVVPDTVSNADGQILKPTGDDTNNTGAANRCAADIQYVSISLQVNQGDKF